MGPQTRFDVTQALSEGELRKCHAKELVETGEGLNVTIPLIALDASVERFHRQDGPSPEQIRTDLNA